MANDETILELARAVRPYLDDLIDERSGANGREIDRALAGLLAAAEDGVQVDDRILVLLREPRTVYEWAANFLQYGYPPDVAVLLQLDAGERNSTLPGEGEPVPVPKFVCPQGDYVFYRRAVGQQMPACRTHGLALVPADR
jgi:hypothetical protein